jgi:hypothetical protein
VIEKSLFLDKKFALLAEQKGLEEQRDDFARNRSHITHKLDAILEQLENLPLTYEMGTPQEQRLLLKEITSNVAVDRRNVEIALKSPFQEIGNASAVSLGAPERTRTSTPLRASPPQGEMSTNFNTGAVCAF